MKISISRLVTTLVVAGVTAGLGAACSTGSPAEQSHSQSAASSPALTPSTLPADIIVDWKARIEVGYPLIKNEVGPAFTRSFDSQGSFGFLLSSDGKRVLALDITEFEGDKVKSGVSVYPNFDGTFDVYYRSNGSYLTTRTEGNTPCAGDLSCASEGQVIGRHRTAQVLFDGMMKNRFGDRWPF